MDPESAGCWFLCNRSERVCMLDKCNMVSQRVNLSLMWAQACCISIVMTCQHKARIRRQALLYLMKDIQSLRIVGSDECSVKFAVIGGSAKRHNLKLGRMLLSSCFSLSPYPKEFPERPKKYHSLPDSWRWFFTCPSGIRVRSTNGPPCWISVRRALMSKAVGYFTTILSHISLQSHSELCPELQTKLSLLIQIL